MDHELSPLDGAEVHLVPSSTHGDRFKVFVGHCGDRSDRPAPVVYLTDANHMFGLALDVIRGMQHALHLPRLLVVGIGYPVRSMAETVPLRMADLSPTVDEGYGELYPPAPAMGGAADLLAFIRDDLKPWVEATFAADATDSTYFGHSLGGLFGTFALLEAPDTFQRYGLASPSLWWDGRSIFAREQAYAEAHDDLSARVFFSVGANETQEGRVRESSRFPPAVAAKNTSWHIDLVDDMERFVTQLGDRRYPGLELDHAVFADEFHVTVAALAFSRSMRMLFDAPR